MQFLRKTIKVGNSAGVLLPKSLLGSEVKVSVVKRPVDIKKKAIQLLKEYFEDLMGVYILNRKPIEILAISNKIKEKIPGKIKINIVPLSVIKSDLKNPGLRKKLMEAEVILNKGLLAELKREIKGS